MHLLAALVVLGAGGGIAAEALAQTSPNQLIAQRKGAMNLQAKYLGPVLGMARGRVPFDARIAQRNADYLAVVTQLAWDDFQQSTVGNANTRAKEDLYREPAKFKTAADAVQTDVQKLVSAARSGDEAAVKSAAFGLARSCNSCHESFATFEFRFPVQ